MLVIAAFLCFPIQSSMTITPSLLETRGLIIRMDKIHLPLFLPAKGFRVFWETSHTKDELGMVKIKRKSHLGYLNDLVFFLKLVGKVQGSLEEIVKS